jgi:group I intron endonuclease
MVRLSQIFGTLPKTAAVYAIARSDARSIYVGQAVNVRRRARSHYLALLRGTHKNRSLGSSWNKYGDTTHVFVVLEPCADLTTLTQTEQKWMDDLKAGGWKLFNHAPAAASQLGLRFSEESRRRVSQSQIGRRASPETRALMSAARMGNKNALGFKYPKEVLKRRSLNRIGRPMSDIHYARYLEGRKKRMKTYMLTNPKGETVVVFGLKAFCAQHGLSDSGIGQVISGRAKHYKGWKAVAA